MHVVTNWSSTLEKNTKHLKFCAWQTFYTVSKISHFPRFLKIVSSACKNHCMHLIDLNVVNLAYQNLISPFCDHKYFMTAAHFRFQCENLKINLAVFVKDFLNSKV